MFLDRFFRRKPISPAPRLKPVYLRGLGDSRIVVVQPGSGPEAVSPEWEAIDTARAWAGAFVLFRTPRPCVLLVDLQIGNSVTNRAEYIATALIGLEADLRPFSPKDIAWYEYYALALHWTNSWREEMDERSRLNRMDFKWDSSGKKYRNPSWKEFDPESALDRKILSYIDDRLLTDLAPHLPVLESWYRDFSARADVLVETIDSMIEFPPDKTSGRALESRRAAKRLVRADFIPNERYWDWQTKEMGIQAAEEARRIFESTGRLPGDPEDVPEELLALRLEEGRSESGGSP